MVRHFELHHGHQPEWANHTFTVVDSTASQSCSELETERLQQYYYAEESAVNTILVDCPAVGEAIEVYWKVTQYQDGTIMDDGWWNTTATSTSMSHTVETDDLPIGVWYAFSATMFTDNGTLYEWHSFNIIPSYNPVTRWTPDEMCGESNARTSIHVTNDANTNTYMGHEYYSDDDFNHEISLDCLITNSTYEVEYILTHYHTGYLVDAGWWNFTATGPTASITETWSNLPIQIWYAVTAMYTFDNGVTISDYEKFYVNSTTGPDLLGYCSFPTFEATPAAVQSGDDLTFTWTMDGDVTDDVYLSLHSGWGAQYYFSSVEDNDGSHTITLPANMNPNEDYTVYIESASSGQRTTVCWKYGSIDVLEDDEGVVLDDIINNFLNTTDDRPRISMWYGKVNQHNENGTWMTDPDGVAGAGLYSQWGSEGWGDRKLEYCQRFWPDTVEIRNSAPEEIVFYTRGNTDAYLTMKPVWLCVQDTDGDGILDPEDDDDDGDGWPDIFEDLCFSDALDPNVMPEDLDGDGLCDALQVLLVGDFEPPEPGFCTDGEITGGNGLVGQDVYTELVVVEKTGGTNQYQYEIHDWSNELHEDLQQDASNHDFRGYYEYYDIFLSDADGTFNPNGSFVTVKRVPTCRPRTLVWVTTSTPSASATPTATSCMRRRSSLWCSATVWASTIQTVTKRPSSVLRTRFLPGSATTRRRSPSASAPPWWTTPTSPHRASVPWLRWLPSARRCSLAAEAGWTSNYADHGRDNDAGSTARVQPCGRHRGASNLNDMGVTRLVARWLASALRDDRSSVLGNVTNAARHHGGVEDRASPRQEHGRCFTLRPSTNPSRHVRLEPGISTCFGSTQAGQTKQEESGAGPRRGVC